MSDKFLILWTNINCFIFGFSWVKKNVRETYGGDEEVRDMFLICDSLLAFLSSKTLIIVQCGYLFFYFSVKVSIN